MAVEKVAHVEFAEIGSRQEALQTIFSGLLDIFYPPLFSLLQKNRLLQQLRLFTTVSDPRSTEALEVFSLQQLGDASIWLASDPEFPDPLLPRHLCCNLFAVQGMSLFPGLIRSTDMIGHLFTTWEASVSLESEVAQLRRGDPNALSALLMRYQNRLYRYLLRIVQEQAEAEDLFQQTWVRVAERIAQFDVRRNFEPWLFALARNLAIDHLRRVRPSSLDEPIGGAELDMTAGERLASNQRPVLEGILERERAGQLASALETLSVSYREVLSLRFEEEMKLEEIAEVLAIPLSTVKTRLRRALERMRQTLESRYPGEDWKALN